VVSQLINGMLLVVEPGMLTQIERRLTAILAADVVGFSRLMGLDEAGTLSSLQAHRKVLDGAIAKHAGRIRIPERSERRGLCSKYSASDAPAQRTCGTRPPYRISHRD
jgi:hypothetical protein